MDPKYDAFVRLWVKVMEIPEPCCLCGGPSVWKDYPGSEHQPYFRGPWDYTPRFLCVNHKVVTVGRVGGPI